MSLNHEDQVLWPVYYIICNLDAKTHQSQQHSGTLLLGSILIVHERVGNSNNKYKDLKLKVYYLAMKTIHEHM